jgi:hypothetical protein
MKKPFEVISEFYGDSKAERSQVLLINHITEGLAILDMIQASQTAKDAFCFHPIVQCNVLGFDYLKDYASYYLAVEYSKKANDYLCCKDTDYVSSNEDIFDLVGPMSKDCRDMLIADKMQNRKDFTIHHLGSHKRSIELNSYFDKWLCYLFSEDWK